jgi:hypothetical protein
MSSVNNLCGEGSIWGRTGCTVALGCPLRVEAILEFEGSIGSETGVAGKNSKGRLRSAVDAWAATGARKFAVEAFEQRVMLDSTVVFNEIMYNPAGTGAASDSQEWVELYNQLGVDVDLSGWSLRSGVAYTFAEGTILAGGGQLVIAADPAALKAATGYGAALGPFTGHLSNFGEKLELADKTGRVMDSVSYDTKGDWTVAPDGSGVSLAKANPSTASGAPSSWIASAQVRGTPGAVNFPSALPTPVVTLNEISIGASGFVELANVTSSSQSAGGLVLKRLGATQDQYVIPAGTTIGAKGYLSLTAAQLGFALTSADKLFLVSADGQSVLDAASAPVALKGRSPDGTGQWLIPSQATPGAANAFQLHNEIVVNEVMYHHQPQQSQAGSVTKSTPIDFDNAQWKYNQSGTDLGTSWLASGYDDSAWSTGKGIFYGGTAYTIGGSTAPVAIAGLYSTGFDASGVRGAVGATDPHWAITPPGATVSAPALIESNHSAWAANDSTSSWISPSATGTDSQPAGDYVYKTTFSLDGYLPSTASLSTSLYADNQVVDVRINGQSTGISAVGYATASGPFVISSGFISGVNTIEFVVRNDGTTANPHGFRAVMSGTASRVSVNTPLTLGLGTYYFRNTFTYAGNPLQTQLALSTMIDDGAVFYLNGVEVYRQNMPLGPVNYGTAASGAIAVPAPGTAVTLTIPQGLLRQGANVLEVEVHQAAGDTSDAAMGLALTATQTVPAVPFIDSPEQWIELYNRSAQTVDMSGWRLNNAVNFTFPAGTTLGPDQYLVVAKDSATLRIGYPSARVLGDYSGSLSRSGDTIELLDSVGNPADQVTYYDAKPWPGAADGGGSSMELRDPTADNSKPEAWAASDESGKSSWNTYTYSGVAANLNGDPTRWNEFVMGLLDSGEVLLDDISVTDLTANTVLLQNGTFESGATAWRIIGNHGGSKVIVDPTNSSNHVLDLIATGATESMHNHAETTLAGGLTVINGHNYQISFRAKWVSGSNLLNTRLYFDRVAKTTAIDVPQANGTPGTRNSKYEANVGPTFSDLTQNVIYPSAAQAVTISVRAADPQGVSSISLFYSVNGGAWSSTPMTLQASGLYTGTIPGQATSATVQFYVQAADGIGGVATYPAAGVNSRALYKVNDGVAQATLGHTIRIVMTVADTTLLYTTTNLMSNAAIGATLIYDNKEVYYDVGVSLHSSERGRYDDARVGFNLDFNADHLFHGALASLVIDRSSSGGGSQSEILIKQAMNHAGGLPSNYNDIIKVIAPRTQNTGGALLQLDPYGSDYLNASYKNGNDGNLYKLELIYYPTATVDGNVQSLKVPQGDAVIGADLGDLGNDKENYRYHYLLSNNRDRDDFSDIMAVAKAFSMTGAALDAATQQLLDVNEWMRMFALQALGGVGDAYGQGNPHNLKLYTRPTDGKMMALQWDWDFLFTAGATSSIFGNSNLAKVTALPTNKHLYYGNMQDILSTTFNTTYMSRWITNYGNLAVQNFSADLTYIGNRSSYALSQLPPQVAFSITSPNNQTVNQTTVTLTGKGWVNVKDIYVQGSTTPLSVSWSGANVDTWTAAAPVYQGSNHLVLLAYDFQGKLIGTQSIDVTSTANLPNLPANLRVTELNYNPAPPQAGSPYDAQAFEFIELKNFGTQTLNLKDAHFTNGITFTFGDVSLAPGEVGVVVINLAAFQSRYGTAAKILGTYGESNTNFNNGGEEVAIADAVNQGVVDFTYDNDPAAGWYATTDGGGATLEVVTPAVNVDLSAPASWRASPATVGGSPGVDDTLPPAAPVDFSAKGLGDRVSLSWSAVNGAASYTVYRSTTPGGEGATPLASGLTGTGYIDLTATGGQTYYYVLSATSPGGEGARSAEASAHAHVPGDANDDLTVDFMDLAVLAQSYNGSNGKSWAQGDFNGDGSVDFLDLAILAQNYNTTRAPAGAAAGPETLAPVLTPPANTAPTPKAVAKATPRPVKPAAIAKPVPKPVVKPVTTIAPLKPAPPPIFGTRKITAVPARKRDGVFDLDRG